MLQNLDIAAGLHRHSASLLRTRRGVDPSIEQALEETGLAGELATPAGILSHGQKQWLEIAMLLVQDARVLLLDEPVAGMSQDERTATGELLQRIAAKRIVLVVEHDMDFMRRFATRVTVLHQGKVLSEGTVARCRPTPRCRRSTSAPREPRPRPPCRSCPTSSGRSRSPDAATQGEED